MSEKVKGSTDSTGQKNQQNKNKINDTSSDGNKGETEGGRIPASSADRTSNQTRGVNDSEDKEIVQNQTENNPPGGEKTDYLPDSSDTGTGDQTENNPPGGEKTDNLPVSSNTGTGEQTGGALVSDSPRAGGIRREVKQKEVSKSGTSEGKEQVKSHYKATQTLEKGSQTTPEPNKTAPTDVRRSGTLGEKEQDKSHCKASHTAEKSQQKKPEVLAAPLLKYQNYSTVLIIIMQVTISSVISIVISVGISCWYTNKSIPPIPEPVPTPEAPIPEDKAPISQSPNLEELKGVYENRVAGLEEKVKLYDKTYTSLKNEQSLLENKVKSYEENITVINEELGKCEAMKSKVTQDLGDITSSVSTLKEDLQKGQSFMYNLKGRLDFADISNLNPEYIFIFLVILGFGEVVIGILIVHMLVKWSKSTWSNRYTTPGSLRSNGDDNAGREIRSNDSEPTPNTNGRLPSVVDRISSGNLKQNICVVGFNKGTMENHRKMVEEMLQGEVGQRLLTAVVTKDEDILNIPRSKVMVVFVNGNGRHNILEGEFELGSLKLTTVRGIEKMGAKVILVYVGYTEAGKLPQDQLCIPKLGSSDKHEYLKRLMKNECLYHVQKDLSEYQRTQLIETVKTGLK